MRGSYSGSRAEAWPRSRRDGESSIGGPQAERAGVPCAQVFFLSGADVGQLTEYGSGILPADFVPGWCATCTCALPIG